jgi:hypothetical protein
MKLVNFQKSIGSFWPYLLIYIILALLFYSTNYRGNWSFWADQELTLGYNGLLLNSGLPQEYLDHPGFFSIHIASILLKISSFAGFSNISDIETFNIQPSLFEGMNYLVIIARHMSLIFVLTLTTTIYFISGKFTEKITLRLLATCLIFVSNGVFYHFTLARTEAFAYLFLIASTYFFLKSCRQRESLNISALTISLMLLFCAALNKAQILIFVPFYFAWTYYFIEAKKPIGALPQHEGYTFKVGAFVGLSSNIYFYANQSSGLGLIFNILLILFLSIYCYLVSKKVGYKPYKSILIINSIYFLSYQVISKSSQAVNRGENLFSNIADPFSMIRFIQTQSGPAGFIGKLSSNVTLGEKIHDLTFFSLGPLIHLFEKVTSPTIFLLFSAGYMVYFRRSISKSLLFFGIYCFIGYYLIALINSIRYENAYHYVLFQEFFLMSFSILLVYQIPKLKTKVITLSTLIFVILLVNMVPYTNYLNWLKRKGHHPFCTSGLIDYHSRMDAKKIRLECVTSKTEN